VLQNSAGISMNRSSGGQAQQGVAIGADQMQPGDLLFYGSTRGINHVAMYIGNGQIVHASTERTGITISNWNYRNPVKIINVLG
jgi:peptidoglycan DL-endopeptidase CwlO